MLFNINTLSWDERLLSEFGIPRAVLPEVRDSCGICASVELLGSEYPIAGIAGDQQAALFGQQCFSEGDAKNTYGTGCFLLMNTGDKLVRSQSGLITTLALGRDGSVKYALEGSVFTAGAVVQWLRDELRLIGSAAESEECALRVSDCAGVYFVPAFSGLGAPFWDMNARGAMFGLTRGAGRDHIVRAALESIAFQTKDVLDAMLADTGVSFSELYVDGGASANDFLMQFQADILDRVVVRPAQSEATALGAGRLALLAVSREELLVSEELGVRSEELGVRRFLPCMDEGTRLSLIAGWRDAVERCLVRS